MQQSSAHVLRVIFRLQQTPFQDLLNDMLSEANATKSDFYEFLFRQDYIIEKTSMYRYFNSNRKVMRFPDEDFVYLFAQYVGLDDEAQTALIYVWQLKRRDHYRRSA